MSKTPPDAPSPDRKRSLEAETSSDEDDERGGRYKRQAISVDDKAGNDADKPQPVPVSADSRARSTGGSFSVKEEEDAVGASVSDELAGGADVKREANGKSEPIYPTAGSQSNVQVAAPAPRPDKEFRMRALISTREAGIIIGKQGRSINDIRNQSGAKVQISDHIPNAQDRILMITGLMDQISKAFSLVAGKMVAELQDNSDIPLSQRLTEIRLLVPNQMMGWLIGRQSQNIKEIMHNSSAQIQAASGSLPNSTERVVSVVGVVDAIHLASYHIGVSLQNHRDEIRGFVPYVPFAPMNPAAYMGGADARGMGGPGGPGGYGAPMPYGFPGAPFMQQGGHPHHPHQQHPAHMMQQQAAAYGYPQGMPGGPPPGGPPNNGAPNGPSQMVQMYIPNDMVGAVIGKQGAHINEIRLASGCKIKIMSADRNSTETLVTVTGAPEANQMALYMLYTRLESERARMQVR
ncbi:uncharacterized protein EV422DRAFT_520876 [Fimicolochytrium jonesii]|uniref:uncharacterized protein n=1 Tax=Fimicolochytrium jonesii TaxID=1396493 RepID=UPI0022FF3996|nr:uncharacterized protein EV422DRAFT_520876 [Fimicolochytrium jonesii]KAI8823391.1 hypothetical protein EV422DRAFT_520876 [Fimicolochytrium jonesii]